MPTDHGRKHLPCYGKGALLDRRSDASCLLIDACHRSLAEEEERRRNPRKSLQLALTTIPHNRSSTLNLTDIRLHHFFQNITALSYPFASYDILQVNAFSASKNLKFG
jgi:hypothetical protein